MYKIYVAECAKGYSGDGSTCSPCDFGKYQDTAGQNQCKTCPASKTTAKKGSKASSECG